MTGSDSGDVRRTNTEREYGESSEEIVLTRVLETVADGIVIVDRRGHITFANASAQRILGREDIMGRSYSETMRGVRAIDGVFPDGDLPVYRLEREIERPDGTRATLSINSVPLRDAQGGVTGIVASFRDITEHKATEEALQEAEAMYRSLVEESLVGVYIVQDGLFPYVNPTFARIFGYTPEEITSGKTLDDLSAPQSRGLVHENVRKRLAGEAMSIHYSFQGLRKDGAIIDVEVHGARTMYHGRSAIIGSLLDITERKRNEEARRKLERRLELQQRQFYRDTILSVTDGKLDVCDVSEVRPYIATADCRIDVLSAIEVGQARHRVQDLCRGYNLEGERLESFMIAVGEAITNAIKHGVQGRVYAGTVNESVWVGVSDKGKGIESLILPKATLRRGFSTKPSLGLGYSIMLEVADRVLLKTNERGTTVILVKNLKERAFIASAEQLPDTWENIPA